MLWKIEYLDSYITTIRVYCKKGGFHGRQACKLDVEQVVSPWECIFQIGVKSKRGGLYLFLLLLLFLSYFDTHT